MVSRAALHILQLTGAEYAVKVKMVEPDCMDKLIQTIYYGFDRAHFAVQVSVQASPEHKLARITCILQVWTTCLIIISFDSSNAIWS